MSGFAAAVVVEDETETTHAGHSTLRRTNTMQLGAGDPAATDHRRRKGKKKKNRGRLTQHGGSHTRRKRKHKHKHKHRGHAAVHRVSGASGVTAGLGMGTIAEEEAEEG